MDRATVYTQEQARSVDFLFAQRATMIGLGKLAQAAFGSNTVVRGLAVTPNSPAALNVLVGIGEIYTMAQVDATPWGALPADTTDTIVKQGLNMAAQTISTPAPSTSGYSINYLIEAQYQDQDNVPVVLPYYNSANPQQPLNGQGGGGAAQATERQGVCVIQAKAGIAAATGTQTTPSVDSGWTALAVVTVANGQSTVTSGNISVPAAVPQLTSLLQMMQTGSTQYAIDTSTTANQVTIALTPPITAYADGQLLNFQAANTNTGPCNINGGGGNIALNGAAGAFQGGEIVAGKFYEAVCRANTGTAVIVGQSGGAQQINPATASQHAVQLGQAQSQTFGYAVDTGSANAIVIAPSPAFTAFPVAGTPLRIKVAAANPGATTVTINSLASASIKDSSGNALIGGEFAANGFYNLISDGTNLRLAPTDGRLLGVQVFTASGTYTPTVGMAKAIAEVQGAGAGAGGAPATAAGAFSGSPGASSGSYAKCMLTAAQIGASQVVTIGAAGAAGSGSSFPSTGGNGGTSSLGSLIICPGGIGSQSYGPTGSTVFMTGGAAQASAPTTSGTVIESVAGNNGGAAFGSAAGGVIGGVGGISPMSSTAASPGAGATGTALGASAAAIAGNAGYAGKIIIWEYA